VALIGSTTRKYTTASTRTLTLSLVMPSWRHGHGDDLHFDLGHPVTTGRITCSPGPAQLGQDLPEPVDDALLVLLNHLERARGRDYPRV